MLYSYHCSLFVLTLAAPACSKPFYFSKLYRGKLLTQHTSSYFTKIPFQQQPLHLIQCWLLEYSFEGLIVRYSGI